MKILITGGAGFIGSNLAKFLLKKSHHLTIVDNLSTGKLSNIESIIDSIDFYECNLEDFDFNAAKNIDAVFHLAAQASVPVSISDFEQSSISNLVSSIRIIDYCSKNKLPFVYASSSALYGDLDIGNDQLSKIDLLSPYAADKYCMEIYASLCSKLYNLRSIGMRFFNVYGPNQDPHSPYSGVISIFIEKMIHKNPITVYGGNQSRDFVYVGDVVNCLYKAMERLDQSNLSETVNILTGKSVTINNLVEILSTNLSVKPDIKYKPLPAGDPEKSDGTSEKMIELLEVNIENFTVIDEGLKKTISYIKKAQ